MKTSRKKLHLTVGVSDAVRLRDGDADDVRLPLSEAVTVAVVGVQLLVNVPLRLEDALHVFVRVAVKL